MPINRIYLYGYKRASQSLRTLQIALHSRAIKAVRRDPNDLRTPKPRDLVLVWGTSHIPNWNPNSYINTPSQIAIASNKLACFKKLAEHNIPIPEFTEDVQEATTWLKKSKVLCRTLLSSSGGKGIILASTPEHMVPAPLYVKYKVKQKEYRVHVFKGTILDVQEKRRSTTTPVTNDYIRNHSNGWIFCRENLIPPEPLLELAKQAIQSLELDFGAVDIIHNTKTGKFFVLEINTAPGLEGSTINKYVEAIIQ